MLHDSKADVPFEICLEQENFRLLEIPSGLLRLITSKTPPRYTLPHTYSPRFFD
jgi:hypothetical protein